MNPLIHLLLGRRELFLKRVKTEDERSKVLASAHPVPEDAEAKRLRAAESQGATPGPRASEPHTIDIPLDPRTRTLLHYQLPQEKSPFPEGVPLNEGRNSS